MTLAELAAWWQKALGLTQWRISVEFDESIYPPNLGVCMPLHEYWQADIRLACPEQAPGTDLEESLVHELLHCVFAPFETRSGTPERKEEERAVELLARSFVAMKRRGAGEQQAFRRSIARVVGEGPRARTARQAARIFAARRGRTTTMDPELLALLMKAGELMGAENLPAEVKSLLEELAAAAANAQGPAAEAEPENEMPASEDTQEPPAPAMPPGRAVARPRQARAAQPFGMADVERLLRERDERQRLVASNAERPGMTPALAAYLETQPLATVRNVLARLAPKPAASEPDARARGDNGGVPPRPVPGPGAPPPAGAPAVHGIDPKDTRALGEAFAMQRLPAIMGANPQIVENVRARMAAGKPVGVLTSERLTEVRALRGAAAASPHAGR